MRISKTFGTALACLVLPAHLAAASPNSDKQYENLHILKLTCADVIESVQNNVDVSSRALDRCTRAFQQATEFYFETMVNSGVGYARGCRNAIRDIDTSGLMSRPAANRIAQSGWRCLSSYANSSSAISAFNQLGIDRAVYEATNVFSYCIAAASGQVSGRALRIEISGCNEGVKRHELFLPGQHI